MVPRVGGIYKATPLLTLLDDSHKYWKLDINAINVFSVWGLVAINQGEEAYTVVPSVVPAPRADRRSLTQYGIRNNMRCILSGHTQNARSQDPQLQPMTKAMSGTAPAVQPPRASRSHLPMWRTTRSSHPGHFSNLNLAK
jgi:hypothetical protein